MPAASSQHSALTFSKSRIKKLVTKIKLSFLFPCRTGLCAAILLFKFNKRVKNVFMAVITAFQTGSCCTFARPSAVLKCVLDPWGMQTK